MVAGQAAEMLPQRREGPAPLGDTRYRALLEADRWMALPAPVRRRFSKRVADGESVVYAGRVTQTDMNAAGRLLAQAARLVGAPLPISRHAPAPAIVAVTEDRASGGQLWTRLYGQRAGFHQVIHSAKRFAGPTGLEEYVGCGIGMALVVDVNDGALVFRSDHYFLEIAGCRLRLPGWLSPGALVVAHHELGDGRFAFTLDLEHPIFGQLIAQRAEFSDLAIAEVQS